MPEIVTATVTVNAIENQPNVELNVEPIDKVEDDSDCESTISEQYIPKDFHGILANGTETHIKWILIKSLMHNVVLRFGCVIFGGAVRDFIRHNYASCKFYKSCNSTKYDDPLILPEWNDRFLIPSDIDLFITKSQHDNFKKYLYTKGYYYTEIKKCCLSYINPLLHNGQYTLIKCEIVYIANGKIYSIKLDTIICLSSTIVIPHMESDFSVNKLIMTQDGIFQHNCNWSYDDIELHIQNKEAYCYSDISPIRYEKLNKKGWKTIMQYSTFIFKLVNTEETCVICLDPLKIGDVEILPRKCKCKYSYCYNCLKYSLKTTSCLMCKKEMCFHMKKADIKMYEKYKLLE